MALSLDDKLLGEKTHYYCSSSEDEGDDDDENQEGKEAVRGGGGPTFVPESQINPTRAASYSGTAVQTGPKGVINDWRRYKQLENEARTNQELEKADLLKRLSVTCRSHLDDEKEKAKDADFMQQMEDLEEFEDEFLKEYRRKRIEEMRATFTNVPLFGKVLSLDANSYVEAIDKEHPLVTIIVHIYEDIPACEAMNGCLLCLAQEYPKVKFCKLRASDAKLSSNFSVKGVPALLIYKNKDIVGSFIGMGQDLGDDFFATDVEAFLQEHGFLPQPGSKTHALSASALAAQEDSGSDFDVD
ncbi:unnamed protein product [Owenia fusiformis]|uniref:Phosducin domain-containing protein n=1 Tax=Owenia fusiformis TaxID=6347 RepID=A0A8J1XG34_OWEFU|nr:unnamed protein product [Owenia fusiformis]